MAITYEAANTTPFSVASTTFSFTPDAGVQADDVFVVAVAHRQDSNVNVPANTLETPVNKAEITTGDRHVTVFVWRATSTSTAAVTFTLTASTVGNVAWARFRGVDVSDPVDVTSPGNYTYPTPNPAPSITTTVANAFVVGGIACGSSSATPGVPGGWTSRVTTTVSTGLIATKGVQASAGATGSAAFTTSPTTINTVSWQLALRPAGAVTAPALTHTLTDLSTPTSISAKIKGTNATSARLKVGTNLAVTTGVVYGSSVTLDANGYADLVCTGLNPWTQYYYAVELTGSTVETTAQVGKAKTLPNPGTPTSFTIGFGSCNEFYDETMSISLTAFTNLNARDPDLFVHLGDISYEDNASSSQASQRAGLEYNLNFNASMRSSFAGRQSVCLASDHDSGGNNAFPGAWSPAIRAARKQVLPVPDCPDPNGLYGSTVFGRVRMIYLDTRNFMAADFSTRLGSAQLAWLKAELNQPEPLKIIWTEQVWNDYSVPEGDDKWCNFPERTTIGNMIAAAPGTVIMAHGDSHMLAADNGTNNNWGGFPTVCAAAFYNYASIKGDATWTQGTYPTTDGAQVSQYGMFVIADTGDDITVQFNGYDSSNTSRVALTVTAEGTPSTPMSAYNFEGSGLSFADQSGGGRTVTLSSSSQRSATAKNGTGAGALATALAGGSSGVAVAPYNATTSRSMTFWARESGAGVWLARWQVTASDAGAFGVYYTGGTVRGRFRKGGTNYNVDSGVAAPVGTYTHYGVTYNATTGVGRLYINGALAGSVTVPGGGSLDAADGIDLAADGAAVGGLPTNWLIDDLRIYNHEIPDFQVAVDMNTPVPSTAGESYTGSLAISAGGTLARTQTAMSTAGTLGVTAGGTLGRAPSGMSVAGTLATTASGTLGRTGSPGIRGDLSMSSSGSLAFTATPRTGGSLAITAAGTLSTGSTSFQGTLSMTAGGTLALSGRIAMVGSLGMNATGMLSFGATPAFTQTLNITATGTLGRAGRPAVSGLLAMGGTGTLSMTPVVAGDSRAQGWVGGQIQDLNLALRFNGVDYPITLVAKVDGEEYPLNHGITPPPEGLAARWTFDDGVEDQIAGRALTLTSTTLVAARGGQALAAPTATGTADSEDGFLDLMGFSIAYWLYTPDNASTTAITRVAFTAAGVTVAELYSGWRLLAGSYYTLSRLLVVTDTGSLNSLHQSSVGTAIPSQQWRHVAGVYDGAEMKLYVNGVLVDSDPKTGVVTDPDAFTIRVQNTALVDDVEIWSRPLDAAEIAAMYEEGL